MLAKPHRLKRERDIERLFKKGNKSYADLCMIRFLPNNEELSRFVVAVGKKVSKKAVRRNRIRRQLSELIRLSLDSIEPGYDVAVLVSPKAAEAEFAELESSLFSAFKKANLLID